MKKALLILFVILITLSGCDKNQRQPPEQQFHEDPKAVNAEKSGTEDKEDKAVSDGNGHTEDMEEWIFVETARDEKDFWISLSDALDGKVTIVHYKDIEDYFIQLDNGLYPDGQYSMEGVSRDGTKICVFNYDKWNLDIIDLLEEKVITCEEYRENYDNNFDVILSKTDGKLFLKDKVGDRLIEINNIGYDNLASYEMSPDGTKCVLVEREESNNCNLVFYDLINKSVYDKLPLKLSLGSNKVSILITQWHNNGELYFNAAHKAYKYNIETEEVTEIGEYIFYPLLSYSGDYLIYLKPVFDLSDNRLIDILDDYETGFYIRDMKSNTDIKLSGELINKYVNKYTYMFPYKLNYTSVDYREFIE